MIEQRLLPSTPALAVIPILLVWMISAPASPSYAQSTWDGSVGGDWDVPANWTPDVVPDLNENVTIDSGQPVVGAGVVAESLASIIGDTGTASLRVENGGTLTTRDTILGNQSGATGSATVSGATWSILGTPTAIGLAGTGTLEINSAGTVDSVGRVSVGQAGGSNGTLTIDGSSSELIAQAGVTVGDPNAGSVSTLNVRNNAALNVTGAFGDVQVNFGGTANLESGGIISTDLFTTEQGGLLNNHASIVEQPGAIIDRLTNLGTVTGSGSQDINLTDFGVLAPDAFSPTDDTGVYTINDLWDQKSIAELQIQLGGLSNGGGNKSLTSFDWVDVTGDVLLAGSVSVQLTAGFTLSLQQEFEIINVGGTLTGSFAGKPQDSVVAVLGGIPLLVNYQGGDGNDVVLYTPASFEADFDSDLDVDTADLAQWEGDYGINGLSDANGDGLSNGLDFLIWQQQFGYDATPLVAATTAIPEPTAALMLGCVVLPWLSGLRFRLS